MRRQKQTGISYDQILKERMAQPFNFEAPVSGGNIFEKNIEHNNQIDKTLKITWNANESNAEIDDEIGSIIDDKSYNWYFHLLFEANYYANTINFECDDTQICRTIKRVIHNAFLLGQAGLYYDSLINEWVCVNIVKTEYEKGKLVGAKIDNAIDIDANYIENIIKNKDNELAYDANIKKLVIFKWNTNGFGAYITHLPFVKLKKQILDQITVASLLSLKQIEYVTDTESGSHEELKHWLKPYRWWIFKRKRSQDRIRLIETEAMINRQQAIMDTYVQTIDIYNDILGKRNNVDAKKERNISSEVDASQEQFDCLQREWLDNFKWFCSDLNNHPNFKATITFIQNHSQQNNDEEGEIDNETGKQLENTN